MIRLVQNSFFGGQLDFEMMGRQDYQRYAKGATKLCNFNVMKRGGLDKRRGFDRVLDLVAEFGRDGVQASTKFRAIPFAYTKTRGFVLLMSGPKCVVVGTNPNNQFQYFSVTDLDGVYNATEIQELDYQQCGDIVFLAHENHPPARIVHDIDELGSHGFHYEVLDFSVTKSGIPSIIGSHITRLPVEDDDHAASIKTETYVASAVFDGVETRPCSPYKNEVAEPWGASDYDGTSYQMPWTESQKIRLTIQPITKMDDEGNIIYPQKVNIYKKAFNYFGLIGSVDVDESAAVLDGITIDLGELQTVENSDHTSTDKMDDATGDMAAHGAGLVGVIIEDGESVDVTLPKGNGVAAKGSVRLNLGCCYYTISGGTAATMFYKGFAKSEESDGVTVNIYDARDNLIGSEALPASSGDLSETISAESGETSEAFLSRLKSEAFPAFVAALTDREDAIIQFRGNKGSELRVEVVGGDVAVTNVRVFDAKEISAVQFDDTYITPDSSITPIDDGEEIPMSKSGDYPSSVSLSQQRLIWASSKNDPERIWMSAVGDFYSYEVHEVITADDSIDFMLPITRFGKINHICEMRKLLLFNSACEWLVDSASSVQGLTYETIQAYPQSYSGSSSRLKPVICNNSLIFCERTGQSVRRFAYDISNDGFAGRDVSILSSSIFEFNSIIDWTYQQFPYSTLWCAMKDGSMASFEYMEEQDIMAWLTHKLGGEGEVVCVATSYAVSPALDAVMNVDEYEYATHEEIFAVVRRRGSLWLERMRPRAKTPTDNFKELKDTVYHALCMDGVRVLNLSNNYQPTTEEGAVWIPADTTDGQTITRDEALMKIAEGVDVYEGFPFEAVYTSVYPNINNGLVGNGQFDIKHIQGAALRLMHSFGGEVIPVGADTAEPIQYFYNDPENDHRAQFDGEGGITLFNHDTTVMALPGVNNRDGRVTVRQGDIFPFSVLSYEIDFEPETGGVRR